MKLKIAVDQYITYRKSLGESFFNNECLLKSFVRNIGQNTNLSDIQNKQVDAFLLGKRPITAYWHNKYGALRGFYSYMISRHYAKKSPLPIAIPKLPQPLVPYIYSINELRALLDASLSYQQICQLLEPYMIRTIILLLYGAGLRISEALNLKLADVDLPQALLTIRETKFHKTRLVPLGKELTQSLSQYALQRQRNGYNSNPHDPFFIGRNGKAIKRGSFERAFQNIRKKACLKRTDSDRFHPRIHDLRHTFAVHRLTAWYKEGADVQKLLPVLSVYLGHTDLSSTSVYLTMTPALLEEAGKLFKQYAFKEESHV